MAASKQGINAGRAFIELILDDSELHSKLKKVGTTLQHAGRQLAFAGAALTAPFVIGVRKFLEIGRAMGGPNAVAAVKLSQAFELLKNKSNLLFATIGAAIAGPLTAIIDKISRLLSWFTKWVESHKTLTRVAAVGAVSMLALGVAVEIVGRAFNAARVAVLLFQITLALFSKNKIAGLLLVVGALVAAAYAMKQLKGMDSIKLGGVLAISAPRGQQSVFGGKLAEQVFGTKPAENKEEKIARLIDETNQLLGLIHKKQGDGKLPVANI